MAQSKNPSSWDPQDDVLLRHLKEIKKLGWKDIAQYFKNRTPNACQFRWRRLKSGNLKTAGKPSEMTAAGGAVAGAAGSAGSTSAAGVVQEAAHPIMVPALPAAGVNPMAGEPMPEYYPHTLPQPGVSAHTLSAVLSAAATPTSTPTPPPMSSGFAFKPTLSSASFTGAQPRQNPQQGKFIKPRSYSHNMGPHSGPISVSNTHLASNDINRPEDENLGLIPKVLVRSRRSSVAQQALTPSSSTPNLGVGPNHSNLSVALNTTLTTSKLRKNSFSSRPRRSSFNMAPPDRAFSTPSRRSSVVQAPSSIASITRRESFNSSNSRRGSAIVRRESFVHNSLDRRESVSNYTDVPRPSIQSFAPAHASSLHQETYPKDMQEWTRDEDNLLSGREENHLSMDELSILLPHRSEEEIQWRIGALDRISYSPVSDSPLDSPERSLVDDAAVETESTERANDATSRQPSQTPFNSEKEASPSLSVSSGSNDREHSPVFSPRPVNRDQSPTAFESSYRPNGTSNKNSDGSSYECLSDLDGHHNHSFPSANSTVAINAHSAPLPSLNSIFKNML